MGEYATGVLTGVLLLVTPFVVFLRHNGYSLLTPESLESLAILAGAGCAFGLTMVAGGPSFGAALAAVLIALFADIQTDWFQSWGPGLPCMVAAAAVPCWLLRDHLSKILSVVLATMLVTTLLTPAGESVRAEYVSPTIESSDTSLPPVVHIILDEQIGIEGIPREFDADGHVAAVIRDFYLRWGFQLFGRAYSRYYDSDQSLANVLNLSASDRPLRYYSKRFVEGMPLEENLYFETMTERGYRIHVYQPDYVDFCRSEGEIDIHSCITYEAETLESIDGAALPTGEKMRLMIAMYIRLSFVLSEFRSGYAQLRTSLPDGWPSLPAWDTTVGRLSPVSAMRMAERVGRELVAIEPGSLIFAHLFLPHYPYAYDAECRLRPRTADWLNAGSPLSFPRRNDARSRAVRYPAYLEQVLCTHRLLDELFAGMRDAGKFDDTTIVVHGDHGSRIDLGPPKLKYENTLSEVDYVDSFSTLFAFKPPGGVGRYDDRMLPIDVLLERVVNAGGVPDGLDWVPSRHVYLAIGIKGLTSREMPKFAGGQATPLEPNTRGQARGD